jgi:hypothetical protein
MFDHVKVNAAVDTNWKVFAQEEITEMTAHWMAFPVQVGFPYPPMLAPFAASRC